MAAQTPLYSLRNLRRRFGDREVLNIPALDLDAGRIYGLLGPNGAGKTTLMRLLAFMDTPSEGSVTFRGREIRPDQAARCRARVVWVPQSPVLFTGTLLYNVEYPMRLKGVKRGPRRAKALELLERVRLPHLAESPAHRLSGGESQRASIARAMAAGAEVLLFDEPTASVDYRSRGEIISLIHELWRECGLSIMVTTHDKSMADELCQEQITLFDGVVVSRVPMSGSASGLPSGVSAIPARLRPERGGPALVLGDGQDAESADPLGGFGPDGVSAATVLGLSESPAGVTLRLSAAPGQSLDLLVHDPDDLPHARRLTLGQAVSVIRQP